MPVKEFTESTFKSLESGNWSPCQLVICEWQKEETDPKKLETLAFKPKPQYFFKWVYSAPGDDNDGATAVRWVNDTSSTQGDLYKLVLDICAGKITKPFDQIQKEIMYQWFSVQVRELKKGKPIVTSASPIDPPNGAPTDKPCASYSTGQGNGAGGDDNPFEA